MGKLIVLEGTDGSGKSTQFHLLTARLADEGRKFRKLVFPQYQEPSSALIRMYLAGAFGEKPGDVNSYAASAFYAVDRYASYKKVWQQEYENGGLILSDRYTTSNAVHQGSKMEPDQRNAFFAWLEDFEYVRLGLPRPDLVIYLDVPTELTEWMMRRREHDTNTHADIHEKDMAYLRLCRQTGKEAAAACGWYVVHCADGENMRSVEDIHEQIYRLVQEHLEG